MLKFVHFIDGIIRFELLLCLKQFMCSSFDMVAVAASADSLAHSWKVSRRFVYKMSLFFFSSTLYMLQILNVNANGDVPNFKQEEKKHNIERQTDETFIFSCCLCLANLFDVHSARGRVLHQIGVKYGDK